MQNFILISRFFFQGGKSKCLVCDEMFWTDALFRQHWKKCVAKWVKTAKHEQENSGIYYILISRIFSLGHP